MYLNGEGKTETTFGSCQYVDGNWNYEFRWECLVRKHRVKRQELVYNTDENYCKSKWDGA